MKYLYEIVQFVEADLVKCLTQNLPTTESGNPSIDAVIFDGAVIVQMLSPGTAQTFEEYFNDVFSPFILMQVEKVKRVDVVWDVYREDSLKKSSATEKRLWTAAKGSYVYAHSM